MTGRATIASIFMTLASGLAWAQDRSPSGAPADWPPPVNDSPVITFLQSDRAEYRAMSGDNGYLWDAQGWTGTDRRKLWIKTEGEGRVDDGVDTAEIQTLYSRMITPFFDLQAGVRQDLEPNPARTHAVLGLQGLAPQWFEIDAALFISDKGDVTARVEAEYDLRLTQRIVAQPRAEMNFAAQDVAELGVGGGVSQAELGVRLRYEITRQVAPYIGLSWERSIGDTADFRRARGEDPGRVAFVIGLRLWF